MAAVAVIPALARDRYAQAEGRSGRGRRSRRLGEKLSPTSSCISEPLVAHIFKYEDRNRAGRLHGHLSADLDHAAGRYMEEIRRIVG